MADQSPASIRQGIQPVKYGIVAFLRRGPIPPMSLPVLLIILAVGFAALAWSADFFVEGASALARHLGVSSLLIGLTVVGIGTSLPEMLVSAIAALDGTPGMALGNALGSNVANVGLILGTTALVTPLAMHSGILRREFPLLMVVVAFTAILLADAALSRLDGVLLLGGLVAVLAWMARQARRPAGESDVMAREIAAALPEDMPVGRAMLRVALGLIVLLVSSRILVWAAVALASQLGVSDLVIGLTIVAVGTSLPELAAGIASVRRGEDELAVGNIVGSNIFNLLAVLGIAGVIAPFAVNGVSLARDYGIMTLFMLAIAVIGFFVGKSGRLGRLEGGILLSGFIAYQVMLFVMQG
ncbi:calcium/sodium antiporter [Spiribacter sp. 221]